jgi:hypothetical protein
LALTFVDTEQIGTARRSHLRGLEECDDGTIGTTPAGPVRHKLLDLANYAAAALVFGQFVSAQGVSWAVILMGVPTWIVFAAWAFWLTGER